jgi:hypothetical protein
MKFFLIAVLTALTAGCVCIPCEGAELFSSPPARIVKTHGPWVLVQRGGESCWMYDACYETRRLATTGKKVLKDTVETAGDLVIGAGALVIGTGHEILQRASCAVKCLVCPRPCKPSPAPPEVREEDQRPPTSLFPEDDGERSSPVLTYWRVQ